MNKSGQNAFVNQLLVFTMVLFCMGGSAGLGTVWLRHQISVTANNNRLLEQQLDAVDRQIDEVTTFIAAEQAPDVLEQRNRDMQLGLIRPKESQVVRVVGSAERRLADKRSSELQSDQGNKLVRIKFDLGGGSHTRQ